MTEPASTTLTPDLRPDLGGYYRWDEPDSPITVFLNLETVERLQVEALDAIHSLPDAGVETGGILTGRTVSSAGRITIIVENFEPFARESGQGPLYSLSARDTANLAATLQRYKSERTPGLSVVGYYRSHNRDHLFLSPADLTLIKAHFPQPENVFLLIKTLPNGACTAGFFFWKGGRIQSEFTDSEAPLIPIRSRPPVAVTSGNAPVSPPADPSLKRTGHPHRRILWRVMLLIAAGLAAVAAFGYLGMRAWNGLSKPPAAMSSLGLDAVQQSDGLAVTWNPASPGVAAADRAVLVIQDGADEQQEALEPAQLRSGSVLYRPVSNRLRLRLDLYQGGQLTSSESVRLFEAKTLVPQAAEKQEQVRAAAASPVTAPLVIERAPLKRFEAPAARPTRTAQDPQTEAALPPPALEPITLPTDNTNGSHLPLLATTIEHPALMPDARAPVTELRPTPARPPVMNYSGPRIIRRVEPAVPSVVRQLFTTEVQVEVTVQIDERGTVTDARIASMKGATSGLLAGSVLNAARRYTFTPAQRNGRAVPGEMLLSFRFVRTVH